MTKLKVCFFITWVILYTILPPYLGDVLCVPPVDLLAEVELEMNVQMRYANSALVRLNHEKEKVVDFENFDLSPKTKAVLFFISLGFGLYWIFKKYF